jgi:hypothetical protein
LREELADKEAELTAALAKSRDLSQELAATGEQLRQQLAAKTDALAASVKELDSLKRSLGEFFCDNADPILEKRNSDRDSYLLQTKSFKKRATLRSSSRAGYFFVCSLMSFKVFFQKLFTTLYNY